MALLSVAQPWVAQVVAGDVELARAQTAGSEQVPGCGEIHPSAQSSVSGIDDLAVAMGGIDPVVADPGDGPVHLVDHSRQFNTVQLGDEGGEAAQWFVDQIQVAAVCKRADKDPLRHNAGRGRRGEPSIDAA